MSKAVSEAQEITLDGLLMPVDEHTQPCWFTLSEEPGCLFLPLFTTEEKLRNAMTLVQHRYAKVKQIDDGPDFLSSIPGTMHGARVRIAIDLRKHENGNWRWKEILLG